jgi:hypothetical protein
MATYGPNGGLVPFTGFSPTLGTDAIVPTTAGNVQFNGMSQGDDTLSKVLFDRGNRPLRRLLLTLLNNVVGTTATETQTRVQAQPSTFAPTDNGGLVPIETVNQLNRATTSADLTNVVAAISRTPAVTYAVDVSGNGGGGDLGR